MKVLIAHFSILDFGGIINNTEGLVRGFQELGHEVDVCLLENRPPTWNTKTGGRESQRTLRGASRSVLGHSFDQYKGHVWPANRRIGYQGSDAEWRSFTERFDLVVWQIPVPTPNKENRGNLDWLKLYDIDVPQVAYSHDGNILKTSWVNAVAHRWRGVACVHSCALGSAAKLFGPDVPLALLGSPQWDIAKRIELADSIAAREPRRGWVTLQTFKRWKHVDDTVRAVPFMQHEGPRHSYGAGIEYYYMRSQDKVKPIYLWHREDRDCKPEWHDRPIWQVAEENGFQHRDYLSNEERDQYLPRYRALIDASWSDNYAGWGAHYNRTGVEGIIAGCILLMRDWRDANSPLQPHTHYLPLPPVESGPKAFAQAVDHAVNMGAEREELVARARSALSHWDCKTGAQTLLDLAFDNAKYQRGTNPANDLQEQGRAAAHKAFMERGKSNDD